MIKSCENCIHYQPDKKGCLQAYGEDEWIAKECEPCDDYEEYEDEEDWRDYYEDLDYDNWKEEKDDR